MHIITSIKADIINDSRSIPTLSVTVTTDSGVIGVCDVPSGASTGKNEAYELRDEGTSRGGVTKAKEIIESIVETTLIGKNVIDQKDIDDALRALDGTPNKQKVGGNSMIGVSIACAKAAANGLGKELHEHLQTLRDVEVGSEHPKLYFNLINGGKHAKTKLSFQEYHLVPQVDTIKESLDIAELVQKELGEIIREIYGDVEHGDEGGYAIPTENIREPLELLSRAVKNCMMEDKVMFALDVAASSIYNEKSKTYTIGSEEHTKESLHDIYLSLVESFPLISIEDPFYEEDFEAFANLGNDLPKVIIVGDDLTVTNIERVTKAHIMKSISGLIIKPNQIGTLSETIETIGYAQKNNIKCIVSHRSGETMDTMIADIVTAFHTFGMKAGARGPLQREVKYQRLLAIQSKKDN